METSSKASRSKASRKAIAQLLDFLAVPSAVADLSVEFDLQ